MSLTVLTRLTVVGSRRLLSLYLLSGHLPILMPFGFDCGTLNDIIGDPEVGAA